MNIKFFYQNIRRVRTKTNRIRNEILSNNYDVICLTETWLNSNIFSEELFDDRYVVYRRDRETTMSSSKEGGGVLAAVSKKLISSRKMMCESDYEDLWLVIKPNNYSKFFMYLCIVYIPPSLPINDFNIQVSQMQNVYLKHVNAQTQFIAIGDFNLPEIQWASDLAFNSETLSPTNYPTKKARHLLDMFSICNFHQYNCLANNHGNILDLVLSDRKNLKIYPTVGLSSADHHHPPFEIDMKLENIKYLDDKKKINIQLQEG